MLPVSVGLGLDGKALGHLTLCRCPGHMMSEREFFPVRLGDGGAEELMIRSAPKARWRSSFMIAESVSVSRRALGKGITSADS